MSYRDTMIAHARITILRLLAEQPDYALNESLLHDLIDPFAFALSRDQLTAELAWLAEQGLATVEDLHGLAVATITQRGLDVAEGRARVPGVKPPAPGG